LVCFIRIYSHREDIFLETILLTTRSGLCTGDRNGFRLFTTTINTHIYKLLNGIALSSEFLVNTFLLILIDTIANFGVQTSVFLVKFRSCKIVEVGKK